MHGRPRKSMFARRLLVLSGGAVVMLGVLGGQLANLTLVQGNELREEAEGFLVAERWLPTMRGRILDRRGRELAVDRPSYSLSVDYRVLSGEWVESRAGALARRQVGAAWGELNATQRDRAIEPYRRALDAHVEAMWDVLSAEGGVPREVLLARAGRIVERVEGVYQHIVEKRTEAATARELARGREISDVLDDDISERITQPIREQKTPHAVVPSLGDAAAFGLMRLEPQRVALEVEGARFEVPLLPGVVLESAGDRGYPLEAVVVDVDGRTLPGPVAREGVIPVRVEGVLSHVLGSMRRPSRREDVEARETWLERDASRREYVGIVTGERPGSSGRWTDRGQYFEDDSVGRDGLERSLEGELRGLRGHQVHYLDTGETVVTDATSGRDVSLTIDAMLQARVLAAMDPEVGLAVVQAWHANEVLEERTPLYGAAVVLDVETRDILALVSTPTYTRDELRERGGELAADRIRSPLVNKALEVPYPPGSIVKAFVLAWAESHGRLARDERIDCTGHLLPNHPDRYRCWIWKQYGSTHTDRLGDAPDGAEAVMSSCNIFFYSLGRRLGLSGIREMYEALGVGEASAWQGEGNAFGLPVTAHRGWIGLSGNVSTLSPSDEILMGIGQGKVAWTPLHAASAYATLAQFGRYEEPRLVREVGERVREGRGGMLELDEIAVSRALEGLERAANDPIHGTGHAISTVDGRELIFNVPGVSVWGKTGTATAPALLAPDEDGSERVVRSGDHSWYVTIARGDESGRAYAVAVIMEYAGSGGRVSGPIANQIVHALAAEGYFE